MKWVCVQFPSPGTNGFGGSCFFQSILQEQDGSECSLRPEQFCLSYFSQKKAYISKQKCMFTYFKKEKKKKGETCNSLEQPGFRLAPTPPLQPLPPTTGFKASSRRKRGMRFSRASWKGDLMLREGGSRVEIHGRCQASQKKKISKCFLKQISIRAAGEDQKV